MAGSHMSTVRSLYKNILLLHRGLPLDMKAIGDEYVKAEFRRHKTVEQEAAKKFLQEWENYAAVLRGQLQHQAKPGNPDIGLDMSDERLDDMTQEQMGQLYELRKETAKPSPFMPPEGAS